MSKPLRLGAGNRPDSHGVEKDSLERIELYVGGEIVSVEAIDGGKTGKAFVVTLPGGEQMIFAAGMLSVDGISVGTNGATFAGALIASDGLVVEQQLRLPGDFSPPPIGANQNNYNGGNANLWAASSHVRFSASGAFQITGFAATQNGDVKVLTNTSGSTLSLMHENAGSSASNRILCLGNLTFGLTTNRSVWIRYDGISQRWRVIA